MNQEESVQAAVKFVQDLVSFFEVNIDVSATVEDDVINIAVGSSEVNSLLIGRNAETLRAFQVVTSNMLRSQDAELTRVSIDVADYKRQHELKIAEKAEKWIVGVRETGENKILELNAADRRVVHKVAKEHDDIETFSEGEGRERHLVIALKST